jgi:hypothetical protein
VQAALLEFLSAAAWTGIISADTLERIKMRLVEDAIELGELLPLLPLRVVLFCEAVPSGQLLDSITKQSLFVVVRLPRVAEPLDAAFQIPFEIIEAEYVPVDETSIESPPEQTLQFAKAEHGDGALPANPYEAASLRQQSVIGVAEKTAGAIPIEFPEQGDHGESLAHARSDELLGVGVENDVVKRLGVAVERPQP